MLFLFYRKVATVYPFKAETEDSATEPTQAGPSSSSAGAAPPRLKLANFAKDPNQGNNLNYFLFSQ